MPLRRRTFSTSSTTFNPLPGQTYTSYMMGDSSREEKLLAARKKEDEAIVSFTPNTCPPNKYTGNFGDSRRQGNFLAVKIKKNSDISNKKELSPDEKLSVSRTKKKSDISDKRQLSREEKLSDSREKLKKFQERTSSNSPASTKRKKRSGQISNSHDSAKSPTNDDELRSVSQKKMDGSHDTNGDELCSPSQKMKSDGDVSIYRTPTATIQANIRSSSSSETLQQLSRQVNGILESASDYRNGADYDRLNSSIAELESRNQDLAQQLDQHNRANKELDTSMSELKSHNEELKSKLHKERDEFENKLRKEIGSLKEQLQVHIQTIGILVAEKSELQSNLNYSQKQTEQQSEEIEELSGRLKASRQRVADLERSFSSANSSSHQFEKDSKQYAKDVDRLKLEVYKLNKSLEESKQQHSELQEKLHSRVSEVAGYEQTTTELKGKLEMAELRIKQLSNQSDASQQSADLLVQLQAHNAELNTRLTQYQDAFQQVSTERDHMQDQYQQHIEQLNQQAQQLVSKINSLIEEREQLYSRIEDLEENASQPSTTRETPLVSEESIVPEPAINGATNEVYEELRSELTRLQYEYDAMTNKYESLIRDNEQLSRFIQEKDDKLLELENTVVRLDEQSADKNQLLDSVQGNKAALSRAITQNKDLKTQFAELQDAFVKMSNDRMDIATKLQSEQHIGNELAQRLEQQEHELQEVRQIIEEKDHQLSEIKENSHTLNKQLFQQEQLADRMRHYEAQGQLAETLQRELNSAQETVNALTVENSELRTRVIQNENVQATQQDHNDAKKDDVIESLNSSICQLEMERNQLMSQLGEIQYESEELKQSYRKVLEGKDIVSKDMYESLYASMDKLQEKYASVMKLRADLEDKNDQLEHRIMVLEGETDTIGEYITLYQQQRAALQRREDEKNGYIAALSQDKELMQTKVAELQALVMQLLQERNKLHDYQLTNHVTPNHIPVSHVNPNGESKGQAFAGSLDSSHLEDWPDYSSSSGDSDASEVEAIVAGGRDSDSALSLTTNSKSMTSTKSEPTLTSTPARPSQHITPKPNTWTIPKEDNTAQKIMHLLTELGSTNVVQVVGFDERNFLPCKCCTGKLLVL